MRDVYRTVELESKVFRSVLASKWRSLGGKRKTFVVNERIVYLLLPKQSVLGETPMNNAKATNEARKESTDQH
jgi:hypothetical protein